MSRKPSTTNNIAKNIGWSALAAAVALTCVPFTASAQDRDGRRGGHQTQPSSQNRGLHVRSAQPRTERSRAQMPRPQTSPRTTIQNRGGSVTRNDRRVVQQPRDNRATLRNNASRVNPSSRDNSWRGNDARRANTNRANNVRPGNDQRRDNNWHRNNDNRNWSGRNDNRRWDRNWRNNNRYDWQSYRTHNRNTYRLGRYYAPYRNYSYRRVGIGLTLGSLFYSNRYWVNDPWQYRLPEVYGPYRWVRYYDDVLLVNIYTGQIVDVIYDFFW